MLSKKASEPTAAISGISASAPIQLGGGKSPGSGAISTIVGKDTRFSGKLNIDGSLRIDGYLEGEIESSGDLVIAESGNVQATVLTQNLMLSGVLKGSVRVIGRLEIAPTGILVGEVEVGQLVVEPGGVLSGSCRMKYEGDSKAEVQPSPSPQD